MKSFCENYNLKSLVKQPTCYKNPDKPAFIDLILTNVPCRFHKYMCNRDRTVWKLSRKTFQKKCPRVINYRSDRDFSNETVRVPLINYLLNEVFVNNDHALEKFCKTTMDTLNSFAPIKKKYALDNQILFMTKVLSKETMTKSRLRNKYLKHNTEENRLLYTQQRSKCVFLFFWEKLKYISREI